MQVVDADMLWKGRLLTRNGNDARRASRWILVTVFPDPCTVASLGGSFGCIPLGADASCSRLAFLSAY